MSWFEIQWKETPSNSPHLYNELTFHQNFNVNRLRVVKCFFFHRFTNEVQEMTHFPAVKAQVYLLIVHTFHMLMLHLHPDVTKAHNSLSGQHISPSPFLFLQPGHKSFRNLPRRSDPRHSGATCSRANVGRAPRGGAGVEAGVRRALDSRGWRGKHRSLIRPALQSGQRGSVGVLSSPASGLTGIHKNSTMGLSVFLNNN